MKLGLLGGGQLGWMMALAAKPLGIECRIFEPNRECVASQAAKHVCAQWDDLDAATEFAQGLDAVTYEFENVPVEAVEYIASGRPVFPPVQCLAVAQDRYHEKRFFERYNVDIGVWRLVGTFKELESATEDIGLPAVLKTRRFGYDGKGQVVLHPGDSLTAAWDTIERRPAILEAFQPFTRELSCISVRSRDGEIRHYPLCENEHEAGILKLTRAPGRNVNEDLENQAHENARRILEALGYVGVLTVEYFEVDGRLFANEMAPRVHNSGHWSIEGAAVSQFENHVRAVCGLPLGNTSAKGFAAMLNIVGKEPPEAFPELVGAHLHLYGKSVRIGRKLGHIGVLSESEAEREAAIRTLAPYAPHLTG